VQISGTGSAKGYDVSVLVGATPVFFQFKRSFVLTTRRAQEIQCGDFTTPVLYRMHLRQTDLYRQHKALCSLEQRGNAVFYVTSQIGSFDELTSAYKKRGILSDTAALFSPMEIVLPDDVSPHHFCFSALPATAHSQPRRTAGGSHPQNLLAAETGAPRRARLSSG
jgi:hypothetical protein